MLHLLRFIWILAILINISSIIWFIFGTTANFQREADLVSTVIFVYFGIPSILLIILSIILLFKGWIPSSSWGIVIVSIIILSMLSISPTLFKNVTTSGWLSENVVTDTLQITADGQYEYQFELINLFQKNSNARLCIKRISTGEEIRFPLDMPINKIKVLSRGKVNYWIVMEETAEKDKYILYTTSEFPLSDEKYEIDVRKREAVKVQ